MKNRIVFVTLGFFFLMSIGYSMLSTQIGSNADWKVNPRMINGIRSEQGPLLAIGRLYPMTPTPYVSAAYYLAERPESVPLFFVVSDFDMQLREMTGETSWKQPNDGCWASTDPRPVFRYNGEMIEVPVSIPSKSFCVNMPVITENNVFVLRKNGDLVRQNMNIRTPEQLDEVMDAVFLNHNSDNALEEVSRILKGSQQ